MKGYGGESKKAYNDAGQIASETIQNIRTVATLTKEKVFLDSYMKGIELPHKLTLKAAFISSIGFGFSQGVLFFAYASTFLVSPAFYFQSLSIMDHV